MDEFVSIREQLAVQILFHEAEDALEQRIERLLIGADRGDAELGALQKVLAPYLRSGDLELVADPALQTLDDHPLLFQPAAARKVDVEDGVGENHDEPVDGRR
jgi:hypothetical protein